MKNLFTLLLLTSLAAPAAEPKRLWADSFLGKKAPELVVESWIGTKPETKGKFVLVDFWATWCGPCRKAIPELNTLHKEFGDRLVLPSDVVAMGPGGKIGDPEAGGEVRNMGRSVPDGWMGLDIGPGSAAEFADHVLEASTVLWNGPMGVFEDPRFEAGTRSVAQAVADCRGFTVIGGGDSAAAIAQFGFEDQVDHISTGGGASLELIERGDLPGVEALRRAPNAVEADESDEFNE